ncbi:regulator of conidiation-1 [Colletotrichum acutatum]
MAGLEISPAAHRCYDSLSSLAQEFERSRNKWEYELKERDLAQLFERFEQWAENLGALRQLSSKLSLDHRLRDSPTVRASIFSMLEDLNESAKMEIVSGGRPNRVMPTLDITEEELEEFDISSSSSESGASITSNSSRDSRHDKPSEIQKLLSAIRTSLNSLFKASVFIRKFAAEDRRQRASKTKPFVNTADLMYIKDKYSFLWETNEPLAIRLAEANARRRQYFKYRQQHQEKLSSQLDDSLIGRRDAHLRTEPKPLDGEPLRQGSIVSGMTKPSILAETEATEFVRNKASEAQLFAISSPEPAMRPARQILASDCPFCDDQWATVEPHAESPAQSDTEDEYENADVHVDTDSFRRHVGHHLVQLSLFSLPRLYTGEVGDLNSAGAVPDGERYSQKGTAFRLGQDHLSRGWKVLIKRMGTLATISLFLGLYDKQRRGNVYPDELAIVTFESLPPSHKDRGDGWFIVHNPTIPKMFDLTLLHTGKLDHPVTDVLDIESRSVIQTLVGHTDDVYKVDISKNGKLLASGSGDRTVRLWSTTTWECLHLIRLPDGVTGVAFSNQNDFLIASTLGTIARVWKPDTIPNVEEPFEQDQTQANIWTCSGHSDSIYDVRFSSDDKYVITASLDESAKVFPAVSQRCDDSSKSLKCLSTLEGHSDYVLSVEVMSNGWVVTASKDRSVRFWDMETGRSIARLNAHSNSVIATAITPSTGTGFMFATASGDLKWRLWSLSLTRPVDSMLPG